MKGDERGLSLMMGNGRRRGVRAEEEVYVASEE